MPTELPPSSYSPAMKTLHWLTALLIVTALPLGIIANGAPLETGEEIAQKAWLFSIHKTVGVTAFFVALLRISFAIIQNKPADLHPNRSVENFMAHLVHWLLYISMLLVPLSGWLHHAASQGFAPILWPFGQSLPLLPKSEMLSGLFSGAHFVFTKLLMVSVALHVVGAIKHIVVDRDETMRRMTFGKVNPSAQALGRSRKPMIAAILIYVIAIGLGGFIGLQKTSPTQISKLAQVSSDWKINSGEIGISVNQFGSDISGQFSDWNAQISYDPNTGTGRSDVTINIASLSLGSLGDQAMGADFFDALSHPTAKFSAEITKVAGQLIAKGHLTLKGKEMPVTLPFSLKLDGDTAVMAAQINLNRMDYNIGANMADEGSLKFAVAVKIGLTATRQ